MTSEVDPISRFQPSFQDASADQHRSEFAERAEAIEGIQRGLADARAGNVTSIASAVDEIRRRGLARKRG